MSVNRGLKAKVLVKTAGKCFYCDRTLLMKKRNHQEAVTIDHYIPLARGGYDDLDNKVPSCRRCNQEKGDLLPEEFELKRRGNDGLQLEASDDIVTESRNFVKTNGAGGMGIFSGE